MDKNYLQNLFTLCFLLQLPNLVTPNDDSLNKCWKSDTKCTILGEFNRKHNGTPFEVNIQCESNSTKDNFASPYWTRFHNIEVVTLNGCEANATTFATEYVPDPESVQKFNIEQFRVDVIPDWSFKAFTNLTTLSLQYNAIAGVTGKSFSGLVLLEELLVDYNSIRWINESAFLEIPQLKRLQLWEKHLDVNFSAIAVLRNLTDVDLELRHIAFPRLGTINETGKCNIENLRIFGSTLENWEVLPHAYFDSLKDLSLNFANLTKFSNINIQFSSLLKLNLSHNFIDEINFSAFKSMPFLMELDLSYNRLQSIENQSFAGLYNIKSLMLQHNILKQMDGTILTRTKNLHHVDLSNNFLRQINLPKSITMQFNATFNLTNNPWECQWLLNISSLPIFHNFIYPKSMDGLSVQGLQCAFHEPAIETILNEVEVVQTPRRSAKHAAKTTLFIIGLGFCLLILLLVLHLKCRSKPAQQPFYREIEQRAPAGRRIEHNVHCDVVRRMLPSTDYEAPIISRRTSMCNLEIYEEIPEKKSDMHLDRVNHLVQRESNIVNV